MPDATPTMLPASPGRTPVRVAAVDLGATSGRIMVCTVSPDVLDIEQLHRFPNGAVPVLGSLHWDVLGIFRELLAGLRHITSTGRLDGIGIDSWAIDYGLIDGDGRLLGNPNTYRDMRTDGILEKVHEMVDASELYRVTGLQELPFTTINQLVAARGTSALGSAETMLLLPDLFGFWLTGAIGAERTNASTTGLYDVRTGSWTIELAKRVGLPGSILPPMREPGSVLGPVLDDVGAYVGASEVPVIAVGSHDTASAVVAVPASEKNFAYISSGTWSLAGLELDQPVLTEAARLAGFTNEGGIDETIRFLKNVMGLWVLSESMLLWDEDLPTLLASAQESEPLRTVVDINHPSLLPPGDMPARLATLALRAGEPVPETPVHVTRCILDSLAVAYRRTVQAAATLADRAVDVIHIVGGGSRNELLCALTADACGLPVLAGPAEAAGLGNALVQARALGVDLPDLAAMRALVLRTHRPRRYEPGLGLDWNAAVDRIDRNSHDGGQ